ncbi:NADP-dependent oxidoreductase [Paenibacillus monticola]|uniref:Zinc-binding dehydrogenase n=1 Tax=Paenibacillus monticola TaxID=2666075 RepID=A0A7X2H6Z8_9BACL|nr:NADP-dependent oxidoreductase [Paenibacillus monticola]MRN53928.1 zinc-binding dehydrogenase [Paenibacillus monticola]
MKAIVLTGFGIPESLEEQEVSVPVIKDTQVLVEMYASSINPGDVHIRSGAIQQGPMGAMFQVQFPYILGFDVAGIVKEVGKLVQHFKPGDRVMGMVPTGSYMNYVAVEEDHLAAIPESLSFEKAGALPTVALTAWQALFEHGGLQQGQRILIHGGAGGVGHAAIQLAKQHGAYVITTAREVNRQFVMELGADEVIDYTKDELVNQISEPVDIVLDTIADKSTFDTGLPGEAGNGSYAVLKNGGKYISIVAFAIGQRPKVRDIDSIFFQARANRADLESIIRNIQDEKFHIHVDEMYPFTAQGLYQAYRKSEMQPKRGKIVISK